MGDRIEVDRIEVEPEGTLRRTCSPYPTMYNILRAWNVVRFKESGELGKEAGRVECQIVSAPLGVPSQPKGLRTIPG